MRFSVLAASTSLLISSALAQVVAPAPPSLLVTEPTAANTWAVGAAFKVQWAPNPASTVPAPAAGITIELFHGDPTHQIKVADLADATTPAVKSPFQGKAVPAVPADWYSVRLNGDSYSHYFFITNATVTKPVGTEPTAPTTGLPVTTASATASATSTASATTGVANITTVSTSTPTSSSKPSSGNSVQTAAGSLAAAAVVAVAAVLAF
ncbi:hypothetical protein EDD11_006566 [Mortierella claussenii]|nr:hypothetical protein EDD11_006566 [Mortierella claussenii]